MSNNLLAKTIEDIAIPGKGILAADESTGTIGKRFATIDTENSEENRRAYRGLLSTTPELANYVSGVILFEETLTQKNDNGISIAEAFAKQGTVAGIKVDKGLVSLGANSDEKFTQGLDGLADRLATYKEQGARFAKWRAVFDITDNKPSYGAVRANAEMLARYAAICQEQGVVPIVEPEILMDGSHNLARCSVVTEFVLKEVFQALYYQQVTLEHIILKPNMVIPGKGCADQSNADAIGAETIKVLRRTVPAAVPTINFLSGGQSSEEATINLQAINSQGTQPWQLSFSYGRALQELCLKAWHGSPENINAAQAILLERAKANSAASIAQ